MTESRYESGRYLTDNPDWHAADSPFKAMWIADILRANNVDPGLIVEIGSGSGEVLVELAKHLPKARMQGFDISPQAHVIAAPKADDRISFFQADYLTGDDPPPDLLMAIDVFEHVDDYMSFLKTMRTRAPLHIFHIPLDLSVQGLLRGKSIIGARNLIGHLHYFYKDTAIAVLQDCGYEVIDWNYTHGAEMLPNRPVRTKLANVPRRALRRFNEDFAARLLGGTSLMVLTR